MKKKRVSSMKIPCRIWLLTVTLSIGQAAFPLGVESNLLSISMNEEPVQQQKVIEVSGTVTDSSGAVIGATVAVKGTSTGVITDINGNFTLKVPVGAIITVSYIGYQNKEIPL